MALIHDHAGEHSDDIIAKPGPEQEALGPLLDYPVFHMDIRENAKERVQEYLNRSG